MKRVPGFTYIQLVLLTFALPGAAAREHHGQQTVPVVSAHQWEVIGVRFQVNDLPEKPIEIDFSATFKNTAGASLDVPGFFNGNKEYVVRFTPPTAGAWKYIPIWSGTFPRKRWATDTPT